MIINLAEVLNWLSPNYPDYRRFPSAVYRSHLMNRLDKIFMTISTVIESKLPWQCWEIYRIRNGPFLKYYLGLDWTVKRLSISPLTNRNDPHWIQKNKRRCSIWNEQKLRKIHYVINPLSSCRPCLSPHTHASKKYLWRKRLRGRTWTTLVHQ